MTEIVVAGRIHQVRLTAERTDAQAAIARLDDLAITAESRLGLRHDEQRSGCEKYRDYRSHTL